MSPILTQTQIDEAFHKASLYARSGEAIPVLQDSHPNFAKVVIAVWEIENEIEPSCDFWPDKLQLAIKVAKYIDPQTGLNLISMVTDKILG